jgi:HK97 family phage prohead protease
MSNKGRRRALPLVPEVRHRRIDPASFEVRSRSDTDEIVISGSPIRYDSWYRVTDALGEFEERMSPGVASGVLGTADVRFLFNHDGLPLARTFAGTMSLQDSSTELRFTARLDARQQLANDLAIAIQRGDVTQMSCGFIVARDEWEDGSPERRTIEAFADLLDVSAVTYPASPTTSIQVAQRMLLAQPVESRARLRRVLAQAAAGKALSKQQLAALRSMLVGDADALPELASVPRRATSGQRLALRRLQLERKQRDLDDKLRAELRRQMREVLG